MTDGHSTACANDGASGGGQRPVRPPAVPDRRPGAGRVSTAAIAGTAGTRLGGLHARTLRDFALAWTITPVVAGLGAAAAGVHQAHTRQCLVTCSAKQPAFGADQSWSLPGSVGMCAGSPTPHRRRTYRRPRFAVQGGNDGYRKHIATRITEILGRRLIEMERRLSDTVFKSVPQRIAGTVATLAGQQRRLAVGPRTAQVALTHEQLAALVGTFRETATKVLGELADSGLIRLARGKITIVDPVGVAAEAGD